MRERIKAMRRALVDGVQKRVPGADWSFILKQRGMFSYTGLTKEQVARLRKDYAIYTIDTGRVCVARSPPSSAREGNLRASALSARKGAFPCGQSSFAQPSSPRSPPAATRSRTSAWRRTSLSQLRAIRDRLRTPGASERSDRASPIASTTRGACGRMPPLPDPR
jgi:hypothetical protein